MLEGDHRRDTEEILEVEPPLCEDLPGTGALPPEGNTERVTGTVSRCGG